MSPCLDARSLKTNFDRSSVRDTNRTSTGREFATFSLCPRFHGISFDPLLSLRHTVHVFLNVAYVTEHVRKNTRLVSPKSKICLSECGFVHLTVHCHLDPSAPAKRIKKTPFPKVQRAPIRMMNICGLSWAQRGTDDVVLFAPVHHRPVECAKRYGAGLCQQRNEHAMGNLGSVLPLETSEKTAFAKCELCVLYVEHVEVCPRS